jgi:hypothetical protein
MSSSTRQRSERRDLLEYHSKKAVVVGLVLATVLFVLSEHAGTVTHLPTIAFGWKLELEIIRAAIAFGVVAVVLSILVRGWGGLWPYKFSTSGLDYEISQGAAELAAQLEEVQRLRSDLQRLIQETSS